MDCCRTARRLGGEDVKVIVRSGFEEMKASPWEKEDALHEDIPILNFMVPVAFTHDNGKLTGVTFQKVKAEYDAKGRRNLVPVGRTGPDHPLRRRAGGGRPGERLPLDRARLRHRVRQVEHAARSTPRPSPRPTRRCSSAATRRSARRTSSGRWRTATMPRCRSTRCCSGEDITERPLPEVHISSQKMGIHEWSYDNDISNDKRYKVPHRDKVIALKDIRAEVELGYDVKLALGEAQRCLNCDIQTVFAAPALHRMRRLRRHLPDGLHHLHGERRGRGSARAAEGALAASRPGRSMSPTASRPGASW